MRLSDAGLITLKRHEGLSLEAYPDPGSKDGKPVTIGYGSTRRLDGGEWRVGERITEVEAAELLRRDAAGAETAVNRMVRVPLTQPQFDALVSFVYNVGAGAFESSTLLRKLNAGDYAGAAAQFDRWTYNDGRVMAGLQRRREAERALFEASAIAPAEAVTELVGERPPAPIFESKPSWEAPVMTPFIAAALPALVQSIPELIRSFGKGEVTERNAKAAEAVLQVVQTATGAPNAQAAVEAIQIDPAALQRAREALEREMWFEVTEAGGGGIEGARAYGREHAGEDIRGIPAFWITLALLPLLYGTVYLVLTGTTEQFSGELRAAIASSVVTGILGGVTGFWLGLKFSAPRGQVMGAGR